MASFIASPSLVGLPTEILREIMRLVLSPRDIQVIVKSVKNNVVTATPDFPLSPFLVRKALYTASHRILDDGLVLWLHTPFAILHLGSFLPDVIRNRVRYFEIRWGKGHDESLGDEIHRYQKLEHGVFTRQTMLSFPNLEAVLLDADADESCPVEDANDKRELEIRLHQDCSRYLRPFAKDHGGIHLDEFDSFDRAIKVHLHVPTCSFPGTAVNEPDYHFVSYIIEILSQSLTYQ